MSKKKHNNPKNKPASARWEFAIALGFVAALIALIVLIRFLGTSGSAGDPTTEPPDSADALPEWEFAPLDGAELPAELGDSVYLTALASADGTFPEDASDEPIAGVLAASFTNRSERTVEYLTAVVTIDGEEYRFAVSTIPPGATVRAFESEKRTAPEAVSTLKAEKEYLLFFEEEPTRYPDEIRTEIKNGTITVTNISGEAIDEDIVIYYKSVYGDSYLGGITYRLRAEGGLAPGASYDGYAPHALTGRTEVLFVGYE